MENLILSFQVVLPLFLMMALGYGVRGIGLADEHTLKQMNNVVFRVFLPLLIFHNIYTTELSTAFNPKLILTAAILVVVIYLLTFGAVMLLEKENRRRGVLIQGIFRSNFIIFGLPIARSLYGDEVSGIISLVIAVVIPLFNALAVVALEVFRGGKVDCKHLLKGIVTNPLILASALGVFMLLTGLKLPVTLTKCVADLSKVATPLALVVLGGSFSFASVRNTWRPLLIGLTGRLVAVPGIFLPICIALGFRNAELVGLLAMLAAPTAVSSFTMAQQMDGDAELAGALVVFGSLCSVATIFFWVFLLKQTGMI